MFPAHALFGKSFPVYKGQSPLFPHLANEHCSRLDLQPDKKTREDRRGSASTSEIGDALPPPLNLDLGDSRASRTGAQRLSHFFDTSRLRTASREERLAALREMRTALGPNEAVSADNDDEGRRNASLAAKLKEKFRIRTRAQSSAATGQE